MKVLMLSRDPKIFEEGSEVRSRMLNYAKDLKELHIVVFSKTTPHPVIASKAKQSYNNLFLYSAKSLWDMYRIGRGLSFDAITAQDPFETGLIGYLLKWKHKVPLELQVHTDFLSPYFGRESLKNKIRILSAKFLIKKADHVRVVSERMKNSIIGNKLKENSAIEVRPIFVDVEKIKNSLVKTNLHKKYPNYDFIILMASRLTKEKNIPLAIAAMREIVKKHPKTLLLIVGEGPERQNMELRIRNYELGKNVIIEPWTNDLSSYYKTADLFLLTSNYEGYGRTAIEAQAAGLPVLMTDVGMAIGEVFPVGDLEALVSKLSVKLSR